MPVDFAQPAVFFLLWQSWTEPLVLLTLCLVVYVAVRHPRWLPLALGADKSSRRSAAAVATYYTNLYSIIWPPDPPT